MGREVRCINGEAINPSDARLLFPAKTFKGSNILCWDHFSTSVRSILDVSLDQWYVEFIELHTDPLVLAKQRIAELEAQNANLQRVVNDQRQILKVHETR